MTKIILILSLCFLCNSGFCQKRKSTDTEVKQKIDNYLKGIIKVNEIPGLAVAVVKNGKVIYEGYYGKPSLEGNAIVSKNTIFGIFSTTKLISTVGVFQLIEKGKLNLEDKISKYLGSLPKDWGEVKIKNLLTHSSGLPDVVRFDDIPYSLSDEEKMSRLSKKPMQFETGNQFSYNQTNYWLLTQIIENITGLTFEEYVVRNQFLDTRGGVVFSSNASEFILNRASRYFYDSKTMSYKKSTINDGIRAHSGNGMNITLQEFIRWNERLDKDSFIKKETKYSMWKPFEFKNEKDNFHYGWGLYTVNKKPSYGFSGGNVAAFRKFVENDMTIIFLSTGYKYFNVQDRVINHVAGLVDKTLSDKYLLADEQIMSEFLKNDIVKAEQIYLAIKKNNPEWNFEGTLNTLGYALIKDQRANDAIKVFELNAKENPKSANAFDSMAEGYFIIGQLELSKQHYIKSLELDPENTNAKEMIGRIETLLKEK